MLKRPIFIYTELSPNPNSMKFVLNFELVPDGLSFDYPSHASALEEGKISPLAADLFQFPFVQRLTGIAWGNCLHVTKVIAGMLMVI